MSAPPQPEQRALLVEPLGDGADQHRDEHTVLDLLAEAAELDLASPQRGVVRLREVASDLVVGEARADGRRLQRAPGKGSVGSSAGRVHHLHAAHAAAVEDHPGLEALDRAALGVTQQAGCRAGHGVVPVLGDNRGQACLDLGLHQ
jgi:hypothetical protein